MEDPNQRPPELLAHNAEARIADLERERDALLAVLEAADKALWADGYTTAYEPVSIIRAATAPYLINKIP